MSKFYVIFVPQKSVQNVPSICWISRVERATNTAMALSMVPVEEGVRNQFKQYFEELKMGLPQQKSITSPCWIE